MGSWLDAPDHLTMDQFAAYSVPKDAIPMEYNIVGDAEVELIFPLDSTNSPLSCHSFTIVSTIPIFFSFKSGGTANAQAPNTAYAAATRFYCDGALPWTTRDRKDRIFVKPVVPGTTGTIYFILSN